MENQKKNILETVRQFCSKWYIVIILFSVITIFWEIIVEFIDDIFIIPFFEPSADRIADGNIWVFIAVLATYLAYYFIKWDSILKEQETISVRRKCLILVALVYSGFRFSGLYVYYGWGWLKYSDCFVYWFPLIGECILWIISARQHPNPVGTAVCPFYPDFPTKEDSFNVREKYADVLIEKINSTFIEGKLKEGAFTILLNEEYGSGKSSFFELIKKKCGDIKCIEFNLLLLARKDDIVTHFFKSFLSGIYDGYIEKTIMAYSKAMSLHYINTIGSLFEQKNKSLELQYEKISTYLWKKKHKILVLIDDVDRLQIDELLTVLKLIRSTANFPNVIYLIAADKSALIKCLETSNISDGDTYLKKFFNFELLFPASYHSVMDEFYEKLSDLCETFGLKNYPAPRLSFPNSLFSNMRDVYRYLNLLSFSMESLHTNKILQDIDIDDLIQLTLVQFFDAHYYRILRDHNDRFLKISSNDPTVLVLKDGEAFCDRSLKDNILESRKIAIGNQAQTSELETNDEVRNSFPNTKDIIIHLVHNMFYDCVHNNDNQRSICFESEYYKYFVGSYREDEWTNAKVFDVMGKDNDDFKKMSEDRRQKGKKYWDSYLHKILCFIKEEDYSPIDIIKKVIILIQVDYQVDYDKSNQWRSLSSFYSINKFQDMVFSCLNKHRFNNKLYPDLTDFFNEDSRIHHLSLILNIIDTYLRHSGDMVFYTHLNNWKNGLIDRFIKQMTENPSDIEISNAFYDVKMLSKEYFNKRFHEHLTSSADPLTWLYRFVKLDNGVLSWDLDYWCGILGDNDLSGFVDESYYDILTEDLVNDIKQLSDDKVNELSSYSKEEHPFLMAAETWITQRDTCNVSEKSEPKSMN